MFAEPSISIELLQKLVFYGIIAVVVGFILVTYGKIIILGTAAVFAFVVMSTGTANTSTKPVEPVVQQEQVEEKKVPTEDDKFLIECESLTKNRAQCIEILEDRNS
jgi:hypothetical protein